MSPLDGAHGALPSSTLNRLNPEIVLKGACEHQESICVAERSACRRSSAMFHIQHVDVQGRDRESAQRFYDGIGIDLCNYVAIRTHIDVKQELPLHWFVIINTQIMRNVIASII